MAADAHFDVVVVGRSLAGLLTAALLARRKFRVRVMDCEGGHPLERAPLFGDTTRLVVRVLDELGLQHNMRTRLEGPWRPVTIALPDRRFVLETEDGPRARELGEVMPGRVDALLDLFARIERYGQALEPLMVDDLPSPWLGWRARRAWKRAVEAVPRPDGAPWSADAQVQLLVRALLRVAGQTEDGTGPLTLRGARALWHLTHGVVPIRDGRRGFARMVSEKVDVLGGQLDGRARAASFEVHRKRIRAVMTSDGGRIGADVVVLAGGEPDLARLWSAAPEPAVLGGRRMGLSVPAAQRPVDLRDPCGWVPTADGPAHLVRVTDDRVVLSWVGGGTPPVDALLPFARIEGVETVTLPFARPSPVDPLGLFTGELRGPLKNQVFVGDWVLPGLGLEGACFSAWHGAALAERLAPRRRR